MKTSEGYSIDERDDRWNVDCPDCNKTFEYEGFFDPSDITECDCGCKFTTSKVWINDNEYIE